MAYPNSPKPQPKSSIGAPRLSPSAPNSLGGLRNKISTMALAIAATCGATSCGGSSTDNFYGVESQKQTITIGTVDQFGNPVDGKIFYNGNYLGMRTAQLSYLPSEAGTISFLNNLEDFDTPDQLELQSAGLKDGESFNGVYTRTGSVANVCPRAVDRYGHEVDADVSVNSHDVDYKNGDCHSINTKRETDIQGGNVFGIYANPIYIPANKLSADNTYTYELLFRAGDTYISVTTTAVDGEIFVDERSIGWKKNDFLTYPLSKDETIELSFGDVTGHKTAESIIINYDDIDPNDGVTYHFWGLYDNDTDALVCFQGDNNGNKTDAKVLVNDKTKLTSGWDYPACVGLDTNETHSAEFQKTQNGMSNDLLEISTDSHTGCEGEFVPDGKLNCIGEYYYVESEETRTQFYVTVNATAPLQGNPEYPVSARYEIGGIDYQQQNYSDSLKADEQTTITFKPLGILQPEPSVLTIDSNQLSVDDAEFNPETNQWEYNIAYIPPADAIETCVTSFNQNGENISFQIDFTFDGFKSLNSWEDLTDCHWFNPMDDHAVTPLWLNGYQAAVNQIYIPQNQVTANNQFNMPFSPESTYHQLCIQNINGEYPLSLNSNQLGWTSFGEKCVWMNKKNDNTIKLDGVGSVSYIMDDPDLTGTYSTIDFGEF